MGLWSGDWLGHCRTLMCFFLSHSFVALTMCFGSLSCWNTHPRPILDALASFNALALMVYMAPYIVPLMRCSCPVPLAKKHPQSNVSTSMFDGVLGVIGSIPPPPSTVSWVDAKELDCGPIWPQHLYPVLLWIIGKLQTACTCAFLSRGTFRAQQDFSPSRHSVTNCFLGDYGPSCLEIIDKILSCSSGLIPRRSHDHWNYIWLVFCCWNRFAQELDIFENEYIKYFFYFFLLLGCHLISNIKIWVLKNNLSRFFIHSFFLQIVY